MQIPDAAINQPLSDLFFEPSFLTTMPRYYRHFSFAEMNRNVIGDKPVIADDDPERVHHIWTTFGIGGGSGYSVEYRERGHGYREYSSHIGSVNNEEIEDDH